jgi:hypothetical protein
MGFETVPQAARSQRFFCFVSLLGHFGIFVTLCGVMVLSAGFPAFEM